MFNKETSPRIIWKVRRAITTILLLSITLSINPLNQQLVSPAKADSTVVGGRDLENWEIPGFAKTIVVFPNGTSNAPEAICESAQIGQNRFATAYHCFQNPSIKIDADGSYSIQWGSQRLTMYLIKSLKALSPTENPKKITGVYVPLQTYGERDIVNSQVLNYDAGIVVTDGNFPSGETTAFGTLPYEPNTPTVKYQLEGRGSPPNSYYSRVEGMVPANHLDQNDPCYNTNFNQPGLIVVRANLGDSSNANDGLIPGDSGQIASSFNSADTSPIIRPTGINSSFFMRSKDNIYYRCSILAGATIWPLKPNFFDQCTDEPWSNKCKDVAYKLGAYFRLFIPMIAK